MRDKIDTFVDFPIQGLDLEGMVGERRVAKQLLAQGLDIKELGLNNLDDPLVYDLFAVDEHMGGLGGGHYRAYAMNHISERWYHFDDSFVTLSRSAEAVVSPRFSWFHSPLFITPLFPECQCVPFVLSTSYKSTSGWQDSGENRTGAVAASTNQPHPRSYRH